MQCGNCGSDLVMNTGFCGNCGAAILAPPVMGIPVPGPIQPAIPVQPIATVQSANTTMPQPVTPQAPPATQMPYQQQAVAPGPSSPIGPQVQPAFPGQTPVAPIAPIIQSHTYNDLAIIALVLTFIFSPAGLILGIISLNQIKKTNARGKELALTSVILSGIFIALFVLALFLLPAESSTD